MKTMTSAQYTACQWRFQIGFLFGDVAENWKGKAETEPFTRSLRNVVAGGKLDSNNKDDGGGMLSTSIYKLCRATL